MKKRSTTILMVLSILMLFITILTGCFEQQQMQLDAVEIREYQGEKLSSLNDFRENSIKGPQRINRSTYQLKITGLVENQINYTYDEILSMFQHYKKIVMLDCVEGWSVKILWEGILVRDLISKATPDANATTIIFKAYDGYTTSFPLNYTTDNPILLAYKMNNATLPPERGFPFQLVAESKWGYKWIKWITEIELSDNENSKGYWESRGYANSGNLNESFFEQ
ncbi:MAG: molybdopterin-dependent oxidoreductase [Candidatus Thermoplasmatota archaeon]|nr:molybdopterin-dependent oxidoreductase [Candidatus Thermoplasmatota archaeon]